MILSESAWCCGNQCDVVYARVVFGEDHQALTLVCAPVGGPLRAKVPFLDGSQPSS